MQGSRSTKPITSALHSTLVLRSAYIATRFRTSKMWSRIHHPRTYINPRQIFPAGDSLSTKHNRITVPKYYYVSLSAFNQIQVIRFPFFCIMAYQNTIEQIQPRKIGQSERIMVVFCNMTNRSRRNMRTCTATDIHRSAR